MKSLSCWQMGGVSGGGGGWFLNLVGEREGEVITEEENWSQQTCKGFFRPPREWQREQTVLELAVPVQQVPAGVRKGISRGDGPHVLSRPWSLDTWCISFLLLLQQLNHKWGRWGGVLKTTYKFIMVQSRRSEFQNGPHWLITGELAGLCSFLSL